jgi:hypothetical protein
MDRRMVCVLVVVALAVSAVQGNTLYGMAENVTLITINPQSGAEKEVTKLPAPPTEAQAQALATMDRVNGIYYIEGVNTTTSTIDLLGFNVKTGKIVSSIKTPFMQSVFVGVGEYIEYDSVNNLIVATGVISHDKLHRVFLINPTTGTSKQVYTVTANVTDFLGGFSCFDPVNSILWLNYALNIPGGELLDQVFGVNTTSGKLQYQLNNTALVSSLDWDPASNLCVGFGLEGGRSRTVLTLDGATGKINVLAKMPGWLIISGSISAFDPSTGKLYGIFQQTGATPKDPFHLVGVNAQTGATVTSPLLCSNDAVCPWSLELLYESNQTAARRR